MKFLVKGAIRIVVEADSAKEAGNELSGALEMIADDEPFGDWDEIGTEIVCELGDDGYAKF